MDECVKDHDICMKDPTSALCAKCAQECLAITTEKSDCMRMIDCVEQTSTGKSMCECVQEACATDKFLCAQCESFCTTPCTTAK